MGVGRVIPEPLRAILFDLDGVLIDSGRAWFRVIVRACEVAGRPAPGWSAFLRTFGQGPEADQTQFFPEWTVAEIEAFYDRVFPEELGAVERLPGAYEVLDRIRSAGLRIGIVTNTPIALAGRVLEQARIEGRVDVLAASGEAADKPAPDLIILALARLGLSTGEIAFVGDSRSDLGAARAAGVFFVGLGLEGGDRQIAALPDLLPALAIGPSS